jgi:hypothetical protein
MLGRTSPSPYFGGLARRAWYVRQAVQVECRATPTHVRVRRGSPLHRTSIACTRAAGGGGVIQRVKSTVGIHRLCRTQVEVVTGIQGLLLQCGTACVQVGIERRRLLLSLLMQALSCSS